MREFAGRQGGTSVARIARTVDEIIGHTPLVELHAFGDTARILAKLESRNPGGSLKDRIGKAMVDAAERAGALRPGGTIVEPTSGNTGIALAMVGAVRGYRVILVMPESASVERREILAAYGAELVLTPAPEGMRGAVARARALAASLPNACLPGQFTNPANPAVHRATTAEEIWADTDGQVDAFVAACSKSAGPASGSWPSSRPRRRFCRVAHRGRTPSRASVPASCRTCWTAP
jgi:cysteine synthase A